MLRAPALVTLVLFSLGCFTVLPAIDPARDFSGTWILEPGDSAVALPESPDPAFRVIQQTGSIHCTSRSPEGAAGEWSFALDGSETRRHIGSETRNTVVKWEGAALLINTLVSGPRSYTVMDRWQLSRNGSVLTITRQVVRASGETEAVLRYRREGQQEPAPLQTSTPPERAPRPALVRQPAPPTASELIVRAGTRIPLSLRNTVDTKHSREGDRIYLETQYPIVVDDRVVIPRGSYVNGTVTISKPAGRVKGKGELFIRFDSLTLPNGVTRDFRSRLGSADASTVGQVDNKEGKVTGERDKAEDARTVATGTAIGAGVGGIAGGAAGHAMKGVGIGTAAGAAAGLASVLLRHRPDAVLPQGSTVEMVLDRDLRYSATDLRF